MEETNNVKKTAKKIWSIWNTAEAVILLAAGVLAIVFGILYDKNNEPFNGNMETILTYSVASFVILDGLLRIIMSFLKQEQRTEESIMLVGGFEITLGVVVMVVLHEIFVETMVYFMAINPNVFVSVYKRGESAYRIKFQRHTLHADFLVDVFKQFKLGDQRTFKFRK